MWISMLKATNQVSAADTVTEDPGISGGNSCRGRLEYCQAKFNLGSA